MTDSEITDALKLMFESGLEGAGIILLLVIAYKIYKVKVRTKSMCCDDNVVIETQNNGTDDVAMDYSTHPSVTQQPLASQV
tara:strand:- start:735 stop:977 length:243 start_codon:yes stop_codon:yes gene_type:complete